MGITLKNKVTKDTERSEQKDFFVPDGTYLCMLNKIEEKQKNDEETFCQCEYEILDCAKKGSEEAIGLRVFDILNMNEKSEWRVINFLDAMYPPKFEGDSIPDDVETRWVVLAVKNEKYNGKENLRVKKFEPATSWDGLKLKTNDEGQQIIEQKPSDNKPKPKVGGRVSI
jgi:hypothetical protein